MVIKNLMAAEQTKREGKFLILFSILNFNRSTSARLLLTADAIRRQGLRCTPFQPATNDKEMHTASIADQAPAFV